MNRAVVVLEQALMAVRRLERLSADSTWAHQACGCRGALLRAVDELDSGDSGPVVCERLERLTRQAFVLLENAARELVAPEDAPEG